MDKESKRKMLLTSDGFTTSKITEALLRLIDQSPNKSTAAIIPTAHGRLKSLAPVSIKAKQAFESMGFQKSDFIDIEFENAEKLYDYDVICLSGGNPYYLLHHLKSSGADKIIKELSNKGTVLVGISAGTVVLGPDIRIVDHFTPQFNHLGLNELTALELIQLVIFPHYGTNNKFPHEKTHETRIQEFEKLYQHEVERITDNEAIYFNGGVIEKIT
ncbi:dipeptidase E [Paenibacillus sp. V4I3]|uniref:Type 1 glutamine amidotransferase-like domain-containing protein n=1 Tax=Paenibacillus sp. V4I3 TaxID=3042305 RepID=UPI002786198C|nr:Type 1 glutamine amidotransferase-like domain-containing protein [Paenibacillus sp. V4I3]MDQ0876519.1 dipeptidase E [Paenibacillus sp. V4I3]